MHPRGKQLGAFSRGLLMASVGLGLLLAVGFGFGAVEHSVAQVVTAFTIENLGEQIGLGTSDLKETIVNVIRWSLGVLALVAVSFIVYGGFLWMTARGDEERILKAKKVIAGAVIGLIIVLMSFAIVTFVAGTAANVTDTGGTIPPGPGPVPTSTAMEIRSITTACGGPPAYREDVFLCSGITITFNHRVQASTVAAAVAAAGSDQLVIEKCSDASCSSSTTVAPAVASQIYGGTSPTGVSAEWVTPTLGTREGKSIVFYHRQELFEPNTYYRVRIPKEIRDTVNKKIEFCRKNAVTPIDGGGCVEQPDYFEWTMRTGTTVDTTRPRVTATSPDSRYRTDPAGSSPDRDVNRAPILTVRLNEAIDPATIDLGQADPANNTVVIRPFDPASPPDANDGTGGTTGPPIDPSRFTVAPDGANTGLEIQIHGTEAEMLDPFTWYEVTVQNLTDLCTNEQDPNPYRWVFETNDVAPGVADVYPRDGYTFACPDTDVQIRYTMSMYDVGSGSCAVDPDPAVGGYVTDGVLTAPDGGRALVVVDDYPGTPLDPNRFCTRYAYEPASGLLEPGQTYQVGVNSRFQINTAGDTLNYGDLANAPSAGPWSFDVKPPDQCANAPRIDRLSPRSGPEGQCFTIQGRYFSGAKDGADEAFFGAVDLDASAASWSERNIVVRAPATTVGPHAVTVQVEHPAPIGTLTSNADVVFDLESGTFDGACLERLNPNAGSWGTRFDATGTDFGAVPGEVVFDGSPTGRAPYASWTDTYVDNAEVLTDSMTGEVRLRDAGGNESNGITFTVFPPIPGQPRVANGWPICGEACPNASIGARFDQDLDPSTINTATVELGACADSDCTAATPVAITALSYSGSPLHEMRITGHDPLTPATTYRVVIRGGRSGVKSASGEQLAAAGLNFDSDRDGNPDAYSWRFTTKADPNECAIASVQLAPAGTTTLRLGQFSTFRGVPRGSPDSCDPGGQDLDGAAYDWIWTTTDPTSVSVTNDDAGPVDGRTDPIQLAEARAVTVGETITASANGLSASATVVVTPDPTFCRTTADCTVNEVGRSCDSVCVANRCTPVINTVSPAAAPADAWTTIQGCWFGNYSAGTSAVRWSPNEEGAVPGPAACGGPSGTWKNYEVVRAVPPTAVDGPVILTRDDGSTDATNAGRGPALPDFSVTGGTPGPQLCRLVPDEGAVGITDELVGDNLGTRGAGDVATFYNGQDATTYPSWTNQSVEAEVPAGAETGDVVVAKGPLTSNPLTFRVLGPGTGSTCTESCTTDLDCSTGGCGSSGCCAPRPTLGSHSPVGIDQCRNVVITAAFGGAPLDTATVNSSTVILRDGATALAPTSLSATATGFTLVPPLLDAGRTYTVEVTDGVRSRDGVRFGGFVWSFSTGAAVCDLDQVSLSPSAHTFTRIVAPGNTRDFTAYAIASNGTQIFPVPGTYNWVWSWQSNNSSVAAVGGSATASETVTALANGDAFLTATASETSPREGFAGARSASASIRVRACDNPWSLVDPADGTYHDTGTWAEDNATTVLPGGACAPYNFSLSYCRGQNGTTLLPDLDTALVRCTNGDRLKEFIFKDSDPDSTDAIGALVFANPEGLSPVDWLEQNQPGEASGGQTTVVQGYPAYRLGTTTYVAATNLDTAAVTCPSVPIANGSFESATAGSPTGWSQSAANPAQQGPAAPLSGTFSGFIDASNGTGGWLTQDIVPPTGSRTDPHTFRIEAWVKVKKVGSGGGGAGLITQCANPDGTPNFTDCNPANATTTYDLFGNAPGASGVLGNDSGWQKVTFNVSNFSGFDVNLRINCFAQPGWQVWCDDVTVSHVTDASGSLCSGGSLDQNIYLLSYTEGASQETIQIFNALLDSWELNLNPALTVEDRAAIARDAQRVADLQRIKSRINSGIAQTGRVPELGGGTFTPNVSTSKWSSWNATLGNAVGSTLPRDPLNDFDPLCSEPGFEGATCWNEVEKRFSCPANSHVYGYRFFYGGCSGSGAQCASDADCGVETCTNPAPRYLLGANLEYVGAGTLRGPSTDLCSGLSPSACSCFTYLVNGP